MAHFEILGSEDLLTEVPPECGEHAYRRGYRDGWRQAIDAVWTAMFERGYTRQDAYDVACDHADGPLAEWLRRCPWEAPEGMELPPRCE